MSKKLVLKEFLNYFRRFYFIPTWTKEKHKNHKELINFLHGLESVKINSNYNSKTTKVTGCNHFTIFKVDEKQLGNMKPYRGQWVMMYCIGRHQTKFFLMVLPLCHNFDNLQSKSLKQEFKLSYDEIDSKSVNN